MEPTLMPKRTYHEIEGSEDHTPCDRRVSPRVTRTADHQTHGHVFEDVSAQDSAHVHMGDVHGGQHTHYHGAPHSQPQSKEISLLDALAFEQMDYRSGTIAPAYANTCNWLFSASPYQRWRNHNLVSEHNGFLWIKGNPGAGKSTLMKHAWQHAQITYGHDKTVSFFFNARGAALGKSVEGMYRCLLHQVVDQVPHLSRKVAVADRSAYQSKGWPVAVLQDLFRRAVLHLCQQTKMSCYIDALDEGDDEDQVRDMVGFFYDLAERAVSDGLRFHVCLASRYYPKISVSSCEELKLEDYAGHGADISDYVHNKLRLGGGELKQHLASEIMRRSRGVFLWVVLVVAILNRENDRGNQHLLLTRLKEVPDGLLQLFQDLRGRDSSDNRFIPAIGWVLHAMRPLEPKELYIAILTSTGALTAENFAWIQQTMNTGTVDDFIISSSKGFLEVGDTRPLTGAWKESHTDRRVQFIHETVREYFLVAAEFGDQWHGKECAQLRRKSASKLCVAKLLASTRKTAVESRAIPESLEDESIVSGNGPEGTTELGSRSIEDTTAISHARLSLICQTYIRISHASYPQQNTQFRYPHKLPFLSYAVGEVLNHATDASENGWLIADLAKDFPWDEWAVYTSAKDYPNHANYAYHKMCTWLQRMVYKGCSQLVQDELSAIATKAKCSRHGDQMLHSLLDACAEGLGSALHIAASQHPPSKILTLLLESGANVNKMCKHVGSPLHRAVRSTAGVKRLLVTLPARGNAVSIFLRRVPRDAAARDASADAVEILLGHGADATARDDRGNTALHYVILQKSLSHIKLLVRYGADLNGRVGDHGNAAQTAGQLNDVLFMQSLSGLGANVTAEDFSLGGPYENPDAAARRWSRLNSLSSDTSRR